MGKTLGIDLGTNSIGWAITEFSDDHTSLIDAGSLIFQEGVAREKNIEKPAVETRTNARSARRHYFRRRLHKIDLIKILSVHDFCPPVPDEQLELWRAKKIYPTDPAFREWQKTNQNDNPYYARYKALTEKLDLTDQSQRYLLGRALYHLGQRRGFLSNRKDQSNESEGNVKQGISKLSAEIADAGCKFLGEYFYKLYQTNSKIRDRYTDRLAHTEREFHAICQKQDLPDDLVKSLYKAIFFQRPLKSQKGLVGKCIFETNKNRCPVSHPYFEEYRMKAFINNIKIKGPSDSDYRPLTSDEKALIIPLFYRVSKDTFDFEDIAKKIAGKGHYSFRDDKQQTAYKFNYRMSTSVSGAPLTAGLIKLFSEDWRSTICSCYTKADGKTEDQIINDIWHVLYSFDSDKRLIQWAIDNLQLTPEDAAAFAKIRVPQGYASLSLKAIKKIIPYLDRGLRYDQAVFVANLDSVIPSEIAANPAEKDIIINDIADLIANYDTFPMRKSLTKEQAVRRILEDIPGIDFRRLDRIYHPSKMDIYPAAELDENGQLRLGSPRTSSIRNPMAMRALFKLRHLINRLLTEGKIDRTTRINIEFARGLNDANMRKAIERYQRDNEKKHNEYAAEIRRLYKESTGLDIEPTDTDILKYQLWVEQNHTCLYTGEHIGITEFISSNPSYDIEHTIPRSLGGDDSQANKTLCSSAYNRKVKRTFLPTQLADHAIIMERIDSLGWNEKINNLSNQIARLKGSSAATKESRDSIIQKRHLLKMQRDYLRDKVKRFTMTEVPEGFTNRQGVDIGIIGKYAREYLKSLFQSEDRQIFTVKGMTTAEFRKMWGLQPYYSTKERINHCHHAIDAITIACIGRRQYQLWAEYLRRADDFRLLGAPKPTFEKPWPTFTEDVKNIVDSLLVVHDSTDNTLKQSRKVLKIRGRKKVGADGNPLYQQGQTVRAMLHKETFYGAIQQRGDIKYVLRTSLDKLSESDIDKIVDPAVRQKIKDAVAERGFKNLLQDPVWMNEEKGIRINKVRIFTPSVTKPLNIKKHRDLSDKPYKQHYHAVNDSNYCLGIYVGNDAKGKQKRSFKLVNNLDAINAARKGELILPLSDANDLPLKWTLKVGTMVLMYENSPEELYNASHEEIAKRLYKIAGLNFNQAGHGYGSINLRYHQEARPSSDSATKFKNGEWKQGESIRPGITVLHTQFNALVQGQDFEISQTGTIKFLRKCSNELS